MRIGIVVKGPGLEAKTQEDVLRESGLENLVYISVITKEDWFYRIKEQVTEFTKEAGTDSFDSQEIELVCSELAVLGPGVNDIFNQITYLVESGMVVSSLREKLDGKDTQQVAELFLSITQRAMKRQSRELFTKASNRRHATPPKCVLIPLSEYLELKERAV